MSKIKLLLFVLITLLISKGYSQDTVKVGNPHALPSKKSELMPFNGRYDFSWSSVIYTQDQLQGLEGNIDQISFYIANAANSEMKNQRIYAKLTNETIANNTNYPNVSDYTLVYSGDITYSGSGWKNIDFTAKLEYVSGKNIEFLFENRDGNAKDNSLTGNQSINNIPKFSYQESMVIKGRRDYKDKIFPGDCFMCDRVNREPIIRIRFTPCRIPGVSISAQPTEVCSGESSLLTVTIAGNTNSTGYNIDWQMSTDNGATWISNNILGGALPFNQYQTPSIINNTLSNVIYWYRARVYKNCISPQGFETINEKFTSPLAITVYPQVNVTINSNINSPICLPVTGLVFSSAITGGVVFSYKWVNLDNATTVSTAGSSFSPNAPGTYKLEVVATNGCKGASNTIAVYATPAISISSNQNPVCLGSLGLLLSGGLNSSHYPVQWQLDGVDISPLGNTEDYEPKSVGTYHIFITSTEGCVGSSNVIIVNPSPEVTISSPSTSMCFGSNLLLSSSVNQTSASTYSFQWIKDGTPINITTNSYLATQSGNYHVLVTNSELCSSTSNAITINMNSPIAVNISSNQTPACLTPGLRLSSSITTGVTYQWFLGTSAISGATSMSFDPATVGDYYLSISENGCSSNSNTLTVLAIPVVNISSPVTDACVGNSIVLTANASSGSGSISSYQWHHNTTNVGTNSLNYSALIAGAYNVEVTNSNGCSSSSNIININIITPNSVNIMSNQTPVCLTSGLTLSSSITTGVTYQWNLGNSSISGATNVSFDPITTGDYYLSISENGCSSNSNTLTVLAIPVANITSPVTDACAGNSIVLTANATAGSGSISSYQWHQNTTNVGTNSLNYSALLTGAYNVEVTNSNGCSVTSNVITINITSPGVVNIISNQTPACLKSDLTLSSSVTTGVTYQWYLGTSAISGATNVSFDPVTAGDYYLSIGASGCSSNSNTLTIYASPIVSISTPLSNICSGSTALLTANVSAGSGVIASYQWHQNTLNVGSNVSTYPATISGAYSVIVTNNYGCSATSNIQNIVVSGPIANAGNNQVLATGGSITLHGSFTGGLSSVNINWTPTNLFASPSDATNLTPVLNLATPTTFQLTVSDESGCSASDYVSILFLDALDTYGVVRKQQDGGYYQVSNDKVYFKFEEEYKGVPLSYTIYNYNKASNAANTPIQKISNCSSLNISTHVGDNRYYIDLTGCGPYTPNNYYLLEVVNSKNEKFYLKFKV